jgi:hypothetical protein
VPLEATPQLTGLGEGAPGDHDAIPVAPDVQGDDGLPEGPQRANEGWHLMDRVRAHDASRAKAPPDLRIAFLEKPARLADGARRPDEQIFDDEVERAPRPPKEVSSIPVHQLQAQAVQLEVAPGCLDHTGVPLDPDHLDLRLEHAQGTDHGAASQSEHEHTSPPTTRDQEDRGGEGPPDDPGDPAPRTVEGREGAVHAELDTMRPAANLDPGGRHGFPKMGVRCKVAGLDMKGGVTSISE